jgi:hypothetical protein
VWGKPRGGSSPLIRIAELSRRSAVTDENPVHSQSTNVDVEGVRAIAGAGAVVGVARISVAMPLEWMVRGYVKAVRRFDEAADCAECTTRRSTTTSRGFALTGGTSLSQTRDGPAPVTRR